MDVAISIATPITPERVATDGIPFLSMPKFHLDQIAFYNEYANVTSSQT